MKREDSEMSGRERQSAGWAQRIEGRPDGGERLRGRRPSDRSRIARAGVWVVCRSFDRSERRVRVRVRSGTVEADREPQEGRGGVDLDSWLPGEGEGESK